MTTITFQNVYVTSRGCAVGPLEASGPLKGKFDICFDDLYCNEKSFEKAEQKLLYSAIDATMRKKQSGDERCGLAVWRRFIKSIVIFSPCSSRFSPSFSWYVCRMCNQQCTHWTGGYMGGTWVCTICIGIYISSHVATAERQFRYPNEYGIQKKRNNYKYGNRSRSNTFLSNKPEI